MAMKLNFDVQGNVELPTFVLARRNGIKIGKLTNLSSVRVKGDMSKPEISFEVHKYSGKEETPYWDQIKDFKLVWCKEWDTWFEIKINANYSSDVTKNVNLTILGAAELSETKIYGMEVNTEADILRDDYVQPTLFYNADKPEASLMHRLLDKTPHYSIRHIDEHLKGIQRVFSFNDRKTTECFDEIAEELDVLFVYNSDSNYSGKPNREVSVYDLKSYCNVCGARGSFVGTCLNCGSFNITEGYGQDTTVFINREGLGEEITVTVNHDEVKNCFRLEAGDDLMTATIRNCNPNGTSYMWEPGTNIEDMDDALKNLLWDYRKDFAYYRDEHVTSTSALPVGVYNAIIKKYEGASEEISPTTISSNLVGYSPIMQHYYDAVDMEVFLQSGLLPSLALQETTAVDEAKKLTADKLSPVAVVDSKYMTLANTSTAVLNAAKIAADPRYKIVVKQSSLNGNTWTGNFTVTNFSDERDSWDSDVINVTVNDDYETYVKQKLRKSLYNGTKGKYGSVAQMIDMSDAEFEAQLKKYNLVALNSINTCFTECLNILSEQGIDKEDAELYSAVYTPIQGKIGYIQAEVQVRETEVSVMQNMQSQLLELKQTINDKLDLETYLGDYWLDFCAYRREETYSNSNYISDYLTNKQLFDLANEFIDLADYELHKVATYTHEITSTLKNLLVMPEFKPLLDYFECGNWIRIQDDEGEIYKLRLLDYEIDFENLQTLSVTFSEVSRTIDGLSPVREILVKSSNIINNYNAAMNKTNSNFESINDSMKDVVTDTEFNNGYIYDSYHDVKDDLKNTEKKIYSDIEVTDTSIRTYVGDVERTLYGEITQTATEIRAEVKDADNGLSSRITQNADKITSEVTDRQNADNQLSSKITQTADEIKAEVAETYETIDVVQSKHELAIATSKEYTDAQIKITSDNINLSVDKKIDSTVDYIDTTLGTELANYSTTAEMNSAIDLKADNILSTVSATYSTKGELADGIDSANDATDEKLKSYSTTVQMNSAIDQKADSITLSVDKQITETKTYAETVANTAESNAKSDTIEKLKSYSTTTEMNSAIDIKANEITQTVSETYYTKTEAGTTVKSLQSQITQNADNITAEVTNRTNADDALSGRITTTAESITAEVTRATKAEGELSSSIKATAEDITSEVKARQDADDSLSSRIQQTATGISMKVNNGKTSSGITITMTKEDGTSTDATGTIEMTGLVKFSDLSGEGTTEINGANITTGTISADRIDAKNLQVDAANISGVLNADDVSGATGSTLAMWNISCMQLYPQYISDCSYITTDGLKILDPQTLEHMSITSYVEREITEAMGEVKTECNCAGYATTSDLSAVASRVSTLENAGYVTGTTVSSITTEMLKGYSKTDHTHDEYALSNHSHSNYLTSSDLSGYVTSSQFTTSITGLSNRITVLENSSGDCSCDLSDYATKSLVQDVDERLTASISSHNHDSTYAPYSHSHSGYASSSHTHSEYASYSHSHSGYLTSSDLSDYATKSLVQDVDEKLSASISSHNHDSSYPSISNYNSLVTTVQGLDYDYSDLAARVAALENAGYCTSSTVSSIAGNVASTIVSNQLSTHVSNYH